LPFKGLIVLNLLNAMQPLVFELVFPFINQMLFETGVVDSQEQVGFLSGTIESCYALMSFLAILPCGYVSDRVGRKPVILLGILGLAISTSSFGISKTYSGMVISRCIGGTMGGTYSAMKIMVGEMTDKSNQGLAFSLMTISYRTGQIMGLPLGGFLAHPERIFSIFNTPFWNRYPFSLPCFVAAGIAVIGVILGFFYLPETLPAIRRNASKKGADSRATVYQTIVLPDEPPAHSQKVTLPSVWTPTVVSLLSNMTAMCLVSEMLFALYPLFAFTPILSGGLGISEATIGIHLAMRSLMPIPMMIFYPAVQRRLGTVRLYQLVLCAFPMVVALFPVLNYLARVGIDIATFDAALVGYFMAWSWCGFAWTCSSIMVNDAAPNAGALATVNSIAQMAVVLPQAVAPALATILFAVSIHSPIFGGNLIWVLLFIFSSLVALHGLTLREPTSDWREGRDKEYTESSTDIS